MAASPANRRGCCLTISARKSLAVRASATAMSGSGCTWIPGLVSDSTCTSTPFRSMSGSLYSVKSISLRCQSAATALFPAHGRPWNPRSLASRTRTIPPGRLSSREGPSAIRASYLSDAEQAAGVLVEDRPGGDRVDLRVVDVVDRADEDIPVFVGEVSSQEEPVRAK